MGMTWRWVSNVQHRARIFTTTNSGRDAELFFPLSAPTMRGGVWCHSSDSAL